MCLAQKLSEFSECYYKLHKIYLKNIGLGNDFDKIKRDPLLAIFYFTVFVHERGGRNPEFQKFHRIAIKKSLEGKDFSWELKNNPDFPDKVWREFKNLTNGKPNEKLTKGPVCDILKELRKNDEPNIITLLDGKDLVSAHKFLLNIKGIGNKVSALILRDFHCFLKLWRIQDEVPDEEKYRLQYRFQPVDRWVERFSNLCWKDKKWSNKHDENAKLIVECCYTEGINPISFNQGAWFVGSHYMDLSRFHSIREEESIETEKCIEKFSKDKVFSAIERFEELTEKGKIFVV